VITRPAESALVVLAPQAEPLVKAVRDQFDPQVAGAAVPAHLTVLVPFMLPTALTPAVHKRLADLCARQPAFDYALAEVRRFPEVLYLAPEPEAPFRALTQSVVESFPDYPPYGGKFADVVPHLTLAELPDLAHMEQIAAAFKALFAPRLPLRLRAEEVVLLDNDAGEWRARETFRLGR
jgi:2'-5' RNA ligase